MSWYKTLSECAVKGATSAAGAFVGKTAGAAAIGLYKNVRGHIDDKRNCKNEETTSTTRVRRRRR